MKNHPVKDVFGVEGKTLSNLMPLLKLGWNLEEGAGEEMFGSMVMCMGEPEK